jgi:hypothetical protein
MMDRRGVLTGLGTALASAAAATRAGSADRKPEATLETFAVLGTGRLGSTLGKRLAVLGYPIIYGSRAPQSESVIALLRDSGPGATAAPHGAAVERADIIVFALPWDPVKNLLPQLGTLRGKLIIDPMNARLNVVAGYPQRPDAGGSVAEQLQAWLPESRVVKAFNTILDRNLANPARAGGPISIPLAGADQAAKERVARLVAQLGLDPVDAGPLIAARYIEDLLRFEVGYVIQNKGQKMFELYMRPVPV